MKREQYLKKLEMYTGRNEVKIVTGMRRTGKSTLLLQLIEEMKEQGVPDESIIYINFEGLIYSYYKKPEILSAMLHEFLREANDHTYIFLDELNIPGWAAILSEMMIRYDVEFFVCSSNESIFYDGYAKDLDYRYVRIRVYPLLFSEFLELALEHPEYEGLDRNELFREFLERGALPGAYAAGMDRNACENYLRDTYSAAVLKDVVGCNNLRDTAHIDNIVSYLLANIGETFSPKAIRDYVKSQGITISVDTVYSVLDALVAAGLIYRVQRYDIKDDRELETQEKYYFCDVAMRNAVYGSSDLNLEAQMESIAYTELVSRGFKVNVGKLNKAQIDFVAFKGDDRTYLNICDYITDNKTVTKEFSPLVRIRDNYFKMVLSMDPETKINKGGIVNYPLVKFLEQG